MSMKGGASMKGFRLMDQLKIKKKTSRKITAGNALTCT